MVSLDLYPRRALLAVSLSLAVAACGASGGNIGHRDAGADGSEDGGVASRDASGETEASDSGTSDGGHE
jgi:hypothetical protein